MDILLNVNINPLTQVFSYQIALYPFMNPAIHVMFIITLKYCVYQITVKHLHCNARCDNFLADAGNLHCH